VLITEKDMPFRYFFKICEYINPSYEGRNI